jgi:hypothetical protein
VVTIEWSCGMPQEAVRPRDALDVLWLFTAPEVYERLVIERGWSPRRLGTWMTGQLVAALL